MKAAVMYAKGELPQYVDIPEPTAKNDNELLVRVKAVAIKHLDKSRASGKHYSSDQPKGVGQVVGGDGVCPSWAFMAMKFRKSSGFHYTYEFMHNYSFSYSFAS
jgi:hypothetical protein